MKQGGPLRRHQPLARSGRLARSPRPDKAGQPTKALPAPVTEADLEALKPLVRERDDHRCVYLGCMTRSGLHVHHRRFRSQGGPHVASNLITLCHLHHDHVHHSGRDEALLLGYVVAGDASGAWETMPVRYWDGSFRLLTDDLCFRYA